MRPLTTRQLHDVTAEAGRIRVTQQIERGPSYEKAALIAFYIYVRRYKGIAARRAAESGEELLEEEKQWIEQVRREVRKLMAPGQSAVSRNIEGPRVKKPSRMKDHINRALHQARLSPGKLARPFILKRRKQTKKLTRMRLLETRRND